MQVTKFDQQGLLLLEPKVFGDERGFFMESFNQRAFDEAVGEHVTFAQDNHSRSARKVLRGLHYQLAPHGQGKLVRVTAGEIFDVAVDVRRGSPTFGQWASVRLSGTNHRQFWIPAGFAHGFVVLSETADVLYKATTYYAPEADRSILWNDPAIGIDWPITEAPILSAKDVAGRPLADAELD